MRAYERENAQKQEGTQVRNATTKCGSKPDVPKNTTRAGDRNFQRPRNSTTTSKD